MCILYETFVYKLLTLVSRNEFDYGENALRYTCVWNRLL